MPTSRKAKPLTKKQVKAAADRVEGKVTAPDDADAPVMGRPSEYSDAFAEQARQLYERGATDVEVADFLGCSTRTILRWSHKYPEFCLALKAGKAAADDRVERSLFHKATGYTFEAEEVFQYQGNIVRAKVVKHMPPDSTAMIFWLKNRRPDLWRDKHEIDHTNKTADATKTSDELRAEILAEMVELGLAPVLPPVGVANRSNGKAGTKH